MLYQQFSFRPFDAEAPRFVIAALRLGDPRKHAADADALFTLVAISR